MLMFGWDFWLMLSRDYEDEMWTICVWTCDMTSRSFFGKMNSILGSVVPLAMFSPMHHLTPLFLPIQHLALSGRSPISNHCDRSVPPRWKGCHANCKDIAANILAGIIYPKRCKMDLFLETGGRNNLHCFSVQMCVQCTLYIMKKRQLE